MAIIPQPGAFTYEEDLRGFIQMSMQFVCDTREEIRLCGSDYFPGWMKITLRRSRGYKNHPTKHLVTVYAEGMNPDIAGGGSGGIDPLEDNVVYEFEVLLEEQPIETCPVIEDLIKRYSGRRAADGSGRVIFDVPFLSKTNETGGGFGSGNATSSRKNPLYGMTSYLTLGSIFRKSYCARSVSSAIFSQVGTIRRELPYGLPTPEGCSWVVLPPKVRRRGSCLTVDEEMRLIRDDSGLRVVYELLHL